MFAAPLEAYKLCAEFSYVKLNSGAHGCCYNARPNILTLCCGRLCLNNSAHKSVKVFLKLFSPERYLADGSVDYICLVKTVFDLTGLCFGNSLGNIRSNRTGLRRRHKTARS